MNNNVWTPANQEAALAQGWGIFAVDGDQRRLEIQRYDEAKTFESDDDAVRFVCRQAINDGAHKNLASRALCVLLLGYHPAVTGLAEDRAAYGG